MLFIQSPLDAVNTRNDRHNDDDEEDVDFDDKKEKCFGRCEKKRLLYALVFLYVLTSAFSVILSLPISLLSMAIPSLVAVFAGFVIRTNRTEYMWSCIVIGLFGFLLKIASIIVYLYVFPNGARYPSKNSLSDELNDRQSKGMFFGLVCTMELLVCLVSCCLQCNLYTQPPVHQCQTAPQMEINNPPLLLNEPTKNHTYYVKKTRA